MSLRNVRLILLVLLALEVALLIWGPQAREHVPQIEAALAAKDKPDWWDDAAMGLRYAAWINAGLLLVLLLTSQWWRRPVGKSPITHHPSQTSHPKWFWPLVILAMLTCLGLRLPLASKSLWWDESWVMFQVVHGKWRPDAKNPGQLKFQEHDWKRCAFHYPKPTNHVPMSLAQKASITAFNKILQYPRGEFPNLAARAPALIASCVAVVLLALLLRSWGWPGAGVAAAFLLALHPWHVRYGVDARAYALVVPLCIAGMFAVSRIWQSRGAALLPWFCWGLVEFLWLWAYPNAVVDVAALNLVLAVAFLRDKEMRTTGLFRLLATNLFAAMALIQVFLPNMMQAMHWAGSENVAQPLTLDLVKSTLSQLVFGTEWTWPASPEAAGLVSTTGDQTMGFGWWTLPFIALVLVTLIVLRLRATEKVPGWIWLVAATPLLSSVIFVIGKGMTGSYFYPRFIIAALPSVLALVVLLFAEAIGDEKSRAAEGNDSIPLRAKLACVFLWLTLLFLVPCWFAQDRLFKVRPYAPLRDVWDFMHTYGNEMIKDGRYGWPLFVCYGHGHEVMPVYSPEIKPALSRAELEKFINQARTERRLLLVMQGHSVHNRALIPDGFTLLDDKTVFEEVKAFAGIDPEFYFRVFRLLPPK